METKRKLTQEEVIDFLMAARIPDDIADKLLEEAKEAQRKREKKRKENEENI